MKDRFDALVEHLLDGGLFLQQAIEVLEKSMIQSVLERSKGNQCAAAKQLGIHRNTLQRKMVEYGLNGARTRVKRKPMARAAQPRKKKTGAA
uniref:Transcriptional regulator, Fis family n=1 Tax=Solibacter usitatus (strain Ellin6076) TaxID=234267 RepID=Q01VW0_SOLUE